MEFWAFWFILCPATLFILLAAKSDWDKRKIPDSYSALLWVIMGIISPVSMESARVVVMFFGLLFVMNNIYLKWKGVPLLCWGDLLIIPPIVGIDYLVVGYPNAPFVIIAMCSSIFTGLWIAKLKDDVQPLAVYAAAVHLAIMLISVVK
jgi:hypothetical protein